MSALRREESDARVIINAADVKLRSFNTKVSRIAVLCRQLIAALLWSFTCHAAIVSPEGA